MTTPDGGTQAEATIGDELLRRSLSNSRERKRTRRSSSVRSRHCLVLSFGDCNYVFLIRMVQHCFHGSFDSTSTALANISRRLGTQSLPPPSLPQLVADQHVPIPSTDKQSQRLIVVLSNASLETFRAAHGPVRGPGREEKYSLLNSDEHIGIMRKMGRDISEARPDIAHQV